MTTPDLTDAAQDDHDCPECRGFGLVRRGPVVDHRCPECAGVEE